MAQSIRSLTPGSKVRDSKNNIFTVIAHNHYQSNETVLMASNIATTIQIHASASNGNTYENSEVDYYLTNTYPKTLDNALTSAVKETPIQVLNKVSNSQSSISTINRKYFTLSAYEMDYADSLDSVYTLGTKIGYFNSTSKRIVGNKDYWTRMQSKDDHVYWIIESDGYISYRSYTQAFGVVPVFTVDNVLVSDEVSNGCYSFIFNQPPVIPTIPNMVGNFGSATTIRYTATDSDDTNLTHYISFDNGGTWQLINPVRNSNIYTYSHVFNELGEYNARIKVVDGANNVVTSNLFIITVNATNPTVNIVSVVDKVVTFKVNCQTHNISKVEVLVNGSVKKTYTSGFDFNLVYEIDRTTLTASKNSVQIKATSSSNLTGTKDMEAVKTTYNLPPVGAKVEIGSDIYTITKATSSGSNHVYTLNNNLTSNVAKGAKIKITQDSVNVLCSLSNLENSKNFKQMKLVKSKKLKGQFEGYVEEKYELECEGRYSAIKLEGEIFNQNVSSDIRELQQYFDYLED